jgi:hypothetical protein
LPFHYRQACLCSLLQQALPALHQLHEGPAHALLVLGPRRWLLLLLLLLLQTLLTVMQLLQ